MLASAAAAPDPAAALSTLATHTLAPAARFHDAVGGLAGYQLACVRMLAAAAAGRGASSSPAAAPGATLAPPGGLDLTDEPAATAAKAAGLAAVGTTAELVPLGGASDRLGLVCEATGAPLPAALLPYGGRPLLEGLLRDTQAREYLAWRVHGAQHTTPVALMTSCAKGGHAHVVRLLTDADWYGRGEGSFKLLRQPLVPVVAAADGAWLLAGPASPELRPGGHGALWKCLADGGGFGWLAERGVTGALVRQISNPLAGTDGTALALAGAGAATGASFGFAACPRRPGATEGVVARVSVPSGEGGRRPAASHVTCVEYTEFEGAGLTEAALSRLPANSNLLFVDLASARAAATARAPLRAAAAPGAPAPPPLGCLPGLVLNTGKSVRPGGAGEPVKAGRLESTMQCLVDALPPSLASSSFAVSGPRRLVTSSAKRARAPGGSLAQTPDGSFLDLARNGGDTLRGAGWAGVPPDADFESSDAAEGRLPLVFVHHPALGPLWSVVARKVGRGRLERAGSELVLDLAECRLRSLTLAGSLRILADAPLGHTVAGAGPGSARLVYSDRGGRARLERVAVRNAGVDWGDATNVPWRHRLARAEEAVVRLRGRSEFDARGVAILGAAAYDVPDGHRLTLRPGPDGRIVEELTRLEEGEGPAWVWRYRVGAGGRVELALEE